MPKMVHSWLMTSSDLKIIQPKWQHGPFQFAFLTDAVARFVIIANAVICNAQDGAQLVNDLVRSENHPTKVATWPVSVRILDRCRRTVRHNCQCGDMQCPRWCTVG